MLKVLLKHLAMLGSNALVRRDVIVKSWDLYLAVLKVRPTEIKKMKESELQQEHSLFQKRNECFDKEKQAKQALDLLVKDAMLNELTILRNQLWQQRKEIERLKWKIHEMKRPARFIPNFLFYIKIATHKDEAKSLWLGELLRTGTEMSVDDYSTDLYKAHKTTLYNSLFCEFDENKEELSAQSSCFKKVFLPLLYYDNTAIIRKTLDDFEMSIDKDAELKNLYKKDTRLKSFSEVIEENNIKLIVKSFKEKVATQYFYSWFRHFLDGNGMTADDLPYIEKFAYVLYARLLLKEFLKQDAQKINTFDDNSRRLLEVSTKIMDADAAFISIKQQKSGQIHTLAKYGILKDVSVDETYFCRNLLFEKEKEKGRPFVIRKAIDDYGEKKLDASFQRATYLTLNRMDVVEGEIDEEKDVLVGIVTFLYRDKDTDDGFIIKVQELGRLLLLLKPETDRYVKHIADEKQFDFWVTKQHLAKLTSATNHGLSLAGWDFDNLPVEHYTQIYNGIIMFSNVVIRHLYSSLINNHEIELHSETIKLSDLFDEKFVALLHTIVEEKMGFDLEMSSIPDNYTIKGLASVYRSFIIQLMYNANNHADCLKFQLLFTSEYIEFKNDIQKQIEEIRRLKARFDRKYDKSEMEEFVKSPSFDDRYGFTLLSLYFYCKSVGIDCVMEYNDDEDDPYFSIKLYYLKK